MTTAGKRTDKQAGGFARAAALTPERRSEISRNAVMARWAGHVKKAGEVPALVELDRVSGSTSDSDARLPS